MGWQLLPRGDKVEVIEPASLRAMVKGYRRSDFKGAALMRVTAYPASCAGLPSASAIAVLESRAQVSHLLCTYQGD